MANDEQAPVEGEQTLEQQVASEAVAQTPEGIEIVSIPGAYEEITKVKSYVRPTTRPKTVFRVPHRHISVKLKERPTQDIEFVRTIGGPFGTAIARLFPLKGLTGMRVGMWASNVAYALNPGNWEVKDDVTPEVLAEYDKVVEHGVEEDRLYRKLRSPFRGRRTHVSGYHPITNDQAKSVVNK